MKQEQACRYAQTDLHSDFSVHWYRAIQVLSVVTFLEQKQNGSVKMAIVELVDIRS